MADIRICEKCSKELPSDADPKDRFCAQCVPLIRKIATALKKGFTLGI